jgi:hypothetical protein
MPRFPTKAQLGRELAAGAPVEIFCFLFSRVSRDDLLQAAFNQVCGQL